MMKIKKSTIYHKPNGRVRGQFIIKNDKGLHTRPSTELVKCATSFSCSIHLHYKGYIVSGKSLLGILMLAAEKGAKIVVEAEGKDAEEAVKELLQLAENKFFMKY